MQNNFYKFILKRWIDVLFSILAIFLISPLMLVIACAIKLYDKGPVFYRQARVGQYAHIFFLIKFRSMRVGADKEGPLVTRQGDVRITPVGNLLRRSKLDELPQLINIFKGEMSFVGPRPEVEKYVKMFEQGYQSILTVRPGITDLATIEFRHEELILERYASVEEGYMSEVLPKKIALSQEYIKNISFISDIKILVCTLVEIIKWRS